MIITAKECFSIFEDKDYVTIVLFIFFCLSVAGIYLDFFTLRDAGLFILATLLARFFSIYRTERLFDGLLRELKIRMENERAKPDFVNGNLSLILDRDFSKVPSTVRSKCLRQLAGEMEIDLGQDGTYAFYPSKVYNQPGKDRRRRKI